MLQTSIEINVYQSTSLSSEERYKLFNQILSYLSEKFPSNSLVVFKISESSEEVFSHPTLSTNSTPGPKYSQS